MDNAYQWVPFYEALADKLLAYNEKRDELFSLIKKIAVEQPLMRYLHFDREDWWGPRHHQIDPFSVIGIMNRGKTKDTNRTMLAKIIADMLEVTLPVPTQFAGIPVLNPIKSFFAGADEVWNLFVLAMKAAETNDFTAEFKTAFEKAIAVSGNGPVYITMGLYWIRPNVFMPLDSNSRAFIPARYGITTPNGYYSGDEYVEFLSLLKNKIKTQTPGITLPEVSYKAWIERGTDTQPNSDILKKNIILYGPPGTGKTYSSIQYAVSIVEEKPLAVIKAEDYNAVFARYLKYKDEGLVAFITFHQSFGYEEFIEGIRPVVASEEKAEIVREIEYEVHDGIFKAFCDKAGTPCVGDTNRVFIIDEINRGNISKIFGELITLIEASKRIGAKEQLRAILPYSGQNFGVPDNVYIIGTMNTADRSIALIDTALRRRFSFVEMQPESDTLSGIFVDDVDIAKMFNTLNKRITALLDREHTIGHSYLLPLKKDAAIERLAEIFENKIIPLLQEYFYDDYEKIQLVLGDNQKPDDSTRFIVKKNDAVKLFGNANIDFPEYYEINKAAFKRIDAYEFL